MAKPNRLLLLSILFAAGAVLLSLCLGTVLLSPAQLWNPEGLNRSILLYARLPRTLAAFLAGAALAVSGAVLQNVLANPLASPSIIGVNAGAGLGVTVCLAAGVFSGWGISLGAFLGSLLAVGLICLFSYRTGASKSTVILGGVALNSILTALCESITVLDSSVAMLSIDFRVGGFSAVSYARLMPAAALICLALTVLMTLCNELDVLTLGDDTAQSVGLNLRFYRILFLVLAAMLAGRLVWGAAMLICLGVQGSSFSFSAFLSGAILNAIPGIIIQIILIPILVMVLDKYRRSTQNS